MCLLCSPTVVLSAVLRIAHCLAASWRENHTWRELLEGMVAKLKVRLEKSPVVVKDVEELKKWMNDDLPPTLAAQVTLCMYSIHPEQPWGGASWSGEKKDRVQSVLEKLRSRPRNQEGKEQWLNRDQRLQAVLEKLRSRHS